VLAVFRTLLQKRQDLNVLASAASAKTVTALVGLALLRPSLASACSVCYGEPDSPAARGLSWAIAALAGIVVMVLAGAVAFFVHAARKAEVLQATDSATSLIDKS
jgi:hypothetical protein